MSAQVLASTSSPQECVDLLRSRLLITDCVSQMAILSYNHRNLEEPSLNALNLYAQVPQ